MTIQETIEKAIEGGYKTLYETNIVQINARRFGLKTAHDMRMFYHLSQPLFWQSLGKAMGWHKGISPENEHLYWRAHWHSFIDHLADGGTPESFFESLTQ